MKTPLEFKAACDKDPSFIEHFTVDFVDTLEKSMVLVRKKHTSRAFWRSHCHDIVTGKGGFSQYLSNGLFYSCIEGVPFAIFDSAMYFKFIDAVRAVAEVTSIDAMEASLDDH